MKTDLLDALLFGGLLAVSACSGGDDGPPSGGGLHMTPALYIAGGQVSGIHVYESPDTVNGDVAPDRLIFGTNTTFSNPYGIDHDSRTDSIFSGNWNVDAVAIYDGASAKDGDVAPSRRIFGASTGLSTPHDVAVDEGRDLLYVAGGHGIAAFTGARTVNGDVAPARLITGPATLISGGGDLRMHLDAAHDRMYAVDPDGATARVLVFDAISTKDGDETPDRVIAGASTTFQFPWGLAVDVGRDLMYVGDQTDNSVMVFENASTLSGDVAPARKIKGLASTIQGVSDVFVDEGADTIYVADADGDQVLIWNGASSADGDVAPDRAISGASTGFFYPGSVIRVP